MIPAPADFANAQQTPPQQPANGPSDDLKYLSHAFEATSPLSYFAWNVDRIRQARDDHALGVFATSGLLADGMLNDARIFSGALQRLGPLLGIPRQVLGGPRWGGKGLAETVRAECEALFAPESTACGPGTLAAGFLSSAFMGVSILQNVWTPRADGSRIDVEVRPWPMQLAQWNEGLRRYQLFSTEGTITVDPNDGKWIVIEPLGARGYLVGALRPLALAMADRGYAIRDRSNHSAAHGTVGVVGTLPEGVEIDSEQGKSFRRAIEMLHRARAGIVKPYGSAVDTFEPKTMSWQIFGQIIGSENSDIMLTLNGIDGSTVYKPISQIDGVRYDLVRLELGAATTQYNAGLVKPWTRYNFGDDPSIVPRLGWLVPDPREQERLDALGRRHQAFTMALQGYRKSGVVVDQPFVDRLAAAFGVEAPKLAPVAPVAAALDGSMPPDPPPPTEAQDDAQVKRDAGGAS